MRQFVLIICFLSVLAVKAQYSNYYTIDINKRVKENVNISGNINKTITTIDYGQLATANALNERNRLENIKYTDEREKNISLEVASDPLKAYDYGFQVLETIDGENAKKSGLKKYILSLTIPHKSLFAKAGVGRYENVSTDGITTEITIYSPNYNTKNKLIDLEKNGKMDKIIVGALNDSLGPDKQAIYVEKKDLARATVFGFRGFKSTIIWEDNYQYTLTDNYNSFDKSIGNGIYYSVKVRTYGNKNEVTFEKLEGRRYYLKRLIEKIISTASVTDVKLLSSFW